MQNILPISSLLTFWTEVESYGVRTLFFNLTNFCSYTFN